VIHILSGWTRNRHGESAEQDADAVRFVISRVGIADVRAFGLAWEDCEVLLDRLGYRTRVEVFA
jgi:hypothetical protein